MLAINDWTVDLWEELEIFIDWANAAPLSVNSLLLRWVMALNFHAHDPSEQPGVNGQWRRICPIDENFKPLP